MRFYSVKNQKEGGITGYLYLAVARFAGISKVVAMKKAGLGAKGNYNSVRINFIRSAICLIVSLAVFFAAGASFTSDFLWICLLSGAANALSMFSWIICSEKANLVLVEIFSLIGSVAVPLMLSPALYGESVSLINIIGVILLFIAAVIFSIKSEKHGGNAEKEAETDIKMNDCGASKDTTKADKGQTKATEKQTKSTKQSLKNFLNTAFFLVLSGLSLAAISVTQKLYVYKVGKNYNAFFNLITFLCVFIGFFAVAVIGKIFYKKSFLPEITCPNPNGAEAVDKSIKRQTELLYVYIIVAAVCIYVFQYFSALAANILPSAVFYPLSQGAQMILSAISDAAIFKRKLTAFTIIGLIITVIGVIIINI